MYKSINVEYTPPWVLVIIITAEPIAAVMGKGRGDKCEVVGQD